MSSKPPLDRSIAPGPAEDPAQPTPINPTHVLGRTPKGAGLTAGLAGELDVTKISPSTRLTAAITRDISAPPPLILLPLRLEYRVVETNVPLNLAGNVAKILRGTAGTTVAPAPTSPKTTSRADAVTTPFRLNPTAVTFTTQRQIWFRWYPDEDFTLHGIAPPSEGEIDALKRFDRSLGSKMWHALDDPDVVSAWQTLSREIAPERALHLIRHRGDPGDPKHLEALGTITLLPEKVALFALGPTGPPSLLGEGKAIDPKLHYSLANVQEGGWHTDFDAALDAGMGLRLTGDAVQRALAASWIIAVGIAKGSGATAMNTLLKDAVANGAFAFLRQDTPTNNTPSEPTPYQVPRANLMTFLRTAVDAEKGVLASPLPQSAELFSEALGINLLEVANAPFSGDLAFEDARAMLRVIGPALIDTAVTNTAALNGIDEEVVIDFFKDWIASRGPLPPVRFGKNPYGVLPVVDLDGLTQLASDNDTDARIEAFIRNFATVVINAAQTAADTTVPVLQPADPDAETKLEAILKLNPVSRRVEVGTVGTQDVQALGCPYVTSTAHPAAQYLGALARDPISSLPDPTAAAPDFPLLYRLARLSLLKTTLSAVATQTPVLSKTILNTRVLLTRDEATQFDLVSSKLTARSLSSLASEKIASLGTLADVFQTRSSNFLAGIQRLEALAQEPDGAARLETLLMETIDLFQHRIDAWATGVAYRRIVKRRRAGRDELLGGYWGLLGRIRPNSTTGGTDGYLQAPSPHQAVTAAIMRSTHLRHSGTGAFSVGLDSARVRRGLKLLEMLQAGISPNEALGYIAERLLHDRNQDILIFRLRDRFPLRDPRDDAALEIRLSDGLLFMNATIDATFPASEVAPLQALQLDLQKEFDALADIVTAESTHLRMLGQSDAANAWLQVLSGDTIPGLPSVLRTRRQGHSSTYRIAVLMDPQEPRLNDTPRAIVEPTLAALATDKLPQFVQAFVEVTIPGGGNGTSTVKLQFKLKSDLGLEPLDLLVGGESEVLLRARHRLISLWRDDPSLQAQLGPFPDRDIMTFINQARPVTFNLDAGTPAARSLLDTATEIRRAVTQGRILEPTDLSAAADPANKLTDERERDLLVGSSNALARRVSLLAEKIGPRLTALRSAIGPVVAAARNYRRLVDLRADAQTLALAFTELTTLRRRLESELLAVSYFAEPGALRPLSTSDMIADPDELERSLTAIADRLQLKATALSSSLPPATPPANSSAARVARDRLISALKSMLDGDGLPVLPPVERTDATRPLIKPSPERVRPWLADWIPVRKKVRRIAALFDDEPWRAHITPEAATGADADDVDERPDESIAPRAHLFGTFVVRRNPVGMNPYAGFIADEWAEHRASRMQQTGLAINYDSPQSEPPHVLLLCEPTGPSAPAWGLASAAAMVAEAVALMKARALAAQDRPLPGPLFPFANQVPFKQGATAPEPRIPVRQFSAVLGQFVGLDAGFFVARTAADVGLTGLFEIGGFAKVRE